MQREILFRIETEEDNILFEYVKDTIVSKIQKIPKKQKIIEVRPSTYVYDLLNEKQKKIFDLLYFVEPYECPVCYDEINYKNEIITDCKHKFCKNCIDTLKKETNYCPYCRNEIKYYNISFIGCHIIKMILIFSKNIFVSHYKKRPKDKMCYPMKWKFF